MKRTNAHTDIYFKDGCGRCSLGGTPQCKVHNWTKELAYLRTLLLNCGLNEELKWGVPCYTFGKNNILILAAFKEYCALSFFKGTLLLDADALLEKPGENTQSVRLIKFTHIQEIVEKEAILKAYIFEAIEVEKAGLKVTLKKPTEHTIPYEFQTKLNEIPALKMAFESLTPGRKRAYLLYFSAAKQAKTRESRIQKCVASILEGKGLNE